MDYFLTDSSPNYSFSDDLGTSKVKIFVYTHCHENDSAVIFFKHWNKWREFAIIDFIKFAIAKARPSK